MGRPPRWVTDIWQKKGFDIEEIPMKVIRETDIIILD